MKRFRVLFLSLGFLLLGILIYQTGPRQVLSHLDRIGWGFLPILGVALCWQVGNTLAWGLAFPGGTALRFRHLFIAKLAGDAINYITPFLGVGGEFVKPYLIRRHVPLPAGFASIVITKTVQFLTGVVYALAGVALALFSLDLPSSVWMTVAGLLGAGVVALLWLLVQQQRNPFSALLGVLTRAGIRAGSPEARRHSAAEMDAHLSSYYGQERARLAASGAIYCLSWVFGVLETWLIVHLLGATIPFETAFFLTSLSSVINTFFFFVPGGVGVWEGGQAFLFPFLGLPVSMGVTVGLVKRIRKIFYVLAGILLISGWLIRRQKGSLEAEAIGMG